MKNTITFKIFLISLLMIFSSCEDIIEPEFPGNQIGTEQVFADSQTAYSALSAVYASLRDNSLLAGNSSGIGSLLGSYTDDLDCFYNDQNGFTDIFRNSIQPTNSIIQQLWNNTYKQIYAVNAIIEGVDNSVYILESDKQIIKGEALFIRSILYYWLQQLFDEIPYTDRTDFEYNRNLGKKTQQELLEQLKNDLLLSSELLSEDYRNAERIYPNLQAVRLLLAIISLQSSDWESAESYCSSIINSSDVSFQTDITKVFHNDSPNVIWQLIPKNTGDATLEAVFYYFNDGPPNAYALSNSMINSFQENDLRKSVYIAEVQYNNEVWYRPFKYKNLSGANTNEYSVIFRLEEAYFVMAETLIRQNRLDEAAFYINATRQRAGLSTVQTSDANLLFEELVQEKRREFFSELGHRFADLKRWNRLQDLTAVKPNWMPFHRAWPLPQQELLLNPNLNPQNNGY